MKKSVALLVWLALIGVVAMSGCAARASGPRPGLSTSAGQIASAGKDLIKLLPRSTNVVIVLDSKRFMEIDAVVKAMEDPKFKEGYDRFVEVSGIDPKRDIAYLGIGFDVFEDADPSFTPTPESIVKSMGLVINLKYDKARLQDLIEENISASEKEIYGGVPVYSVLENDDKPTTPQALAEVGNMPFQMALLDASHIVLGSDVGVHGLIDVYKKKAEPLAKNPEMTVLLSRANKSGIAWGLVSYPPGYMKRFVDSNPVIKSMGGLKGVTLSLDDKNSTLVADLRTCGGTREENATRASTLNGLKIIFGAMETAKEPAVAELLNGIAVTSGEDYTRLLVTVSYETVGKLMLLIEKNASDLSPDSQAKRDEWEVLVKEANERIVPGYVCRNSMPTWKRWEFLPF